MFETILQNITKDIKLGGYDFPHSGGLTHNGFVIRADTQEHLDTVINDIINDTVPIPLPTVSESYIIMSELTLRIMELEMVNATLIEEIMILKGV